LLWRRGEPTPFAYTTLFRSNVGPSNFQFQIYRLDDETGVERPVIFEGVNTENKLWIQLTGLDRLNPQQARQPDGVFDFLAGLTRSEEHTSEIQSRENLVCRL